MANLEWTPPSIPRGSRKHPPEMSPKAKTTFARIAATAFSARRRLPSPSHGTVAGKGKTSSKEATELGTPAWTTCTIILPRSRVTPQGWECPNTHTHG